MDFPVVYRELAGLDSVVQAAGRCNREGKRSAKESEVVLFALDGGVPKVIRTNQAAAEIAMKDTIYPDESPVIQTYFDQLYRLRGEKALDVNSILDMSKRFEFQSIAQNFKLIDDLTFTVYIPRYAAQDDIGMLRKGQFSRSLMRRLGRSAVSVYQWDWKKLYEAGAIERIDEFSGILLDEDAYDLRCGLKFDVEMGKGVFI